MPKLRRKVNYEWFVEPRNSHTNEVIMRKCSPEETLDGFMCENGKPHDLIRCGYNTVRYLVVSENDLGIDFRIFNRPGSRGKLRDVTDFWKNKIKTKIEASKKLKDIKKRFPPR
jgi:hypothetical protein